MITSTIGKAIKTAGGVVAVATALGEKKQTVWNWQVRESVPIERCAEFERVTGFRRWALRPEDWWIVWPELVGTPGAPAPTLQQEATHG